MIVFQIVPPQLTMMAQWELVIGRKLFIRSDHGVLDVIRRFGVSLKGYMAVGIGMIKLLGQM